MKSLLIAFQKRRFLCLLVALLALLVIHPLASTIGVIAWLFDVLLAVVLAVLVLAVARNRIWLAVACILCVPSATLSIGGHLLSSTAHDISLSAGRVMGALFFVMAAGTIVRLIFVSRDVSWDSVFGAICGYLLLGVAWGLAYEAVYMVDATSFRFADPIQPLLEQRDYCRTLFIYYSFVTLTTVGYGDITPITAPAQTLAWVEAVSGQLYLAVLIAGLISALVAQNMMANSQKRS